MRSLIALAAASSLACGPLVSADVDAPELCRDFDPIVFDAAPDGMSGTFEESAPLELPSRLTQPGVDGDLEVELLRLELTAEGVPDMGFIDSASAAVVDAEKRTQLAQYTRAEAAPRDITLVPAAAQVNLADAARQGSVHVATTLTGRLPTTPWTLKVRGCYRGHLAVTWTP